MKERIQTPIEVRYGREDLTRAIRADLIRDADKRLEPTVENVEITEVSMLPTGIVVTVRGTTSQLGEVPDKIFKPPTRS